MPILVPPAGVQGRLPKDLWDAMVDTVVIEPKTGVDGHAQNTYGAAVAYKGRVQSKVRMIRAVDGVEKVSNATCYLNTVAAIGPEDRLTLPAGFQPQQPKVIAVDLVSDDVAALYTVVYV